MRIITFDDIIDTFSRLIQRGGNFFFAKMTFNRNKRTKSAFDETAVNSSNWWMIPMVKERWNMMITGDKNQHYEQYLIKEFWKNQTGLKLLSLGSGSCSHELEFARHQQFDEIVCVDLAENRLQEAEATAKAEGLNNMKYICADIKDFDFIDNYYDIVLFNSSLHHFQKVDDLLRDKIKPCIKPKGYLIINEFVGPSRLQFPKQQIEAINQALKLIDKANRQRFKTHLTKSKFRGSGLLRMIMADPSECIDSASIMPAIHKHFKTVEEKAYGGNILMNVLKDISHHFIVPNKDQERILNKLFDFEDHYIKTHASDFIFGIYEK
jgi:ubiquinone/menaquinone biosynthesis C-methylase UbiE